MPSRGPSIPLPPGPTGGDPEAAIREARLRAIAGAAWPLIERLRSISEAGEKKWDLLAEAPVPANILGTIAPPRSVLRAELTKLGVSEDAVKHWVGKAREIQAIETEARGLKPVSSFASKLRAEVGIVKDLLRRGADWIAPATRQALESDVKRVADWDLPWVKRIDRLIADLVRGDVIGAGRPRQRGVRMAVGGLTRLLRSNTGRPQAGLVGALLKDAGILEDTRCWVPAPTSSLAEQRKIWCWRAKKGKRPCQRDPLRCAVATERVESLM